MSNTNFSDIENAFISKGTVRGETLFLDATSALQLIAMAERKNVEILGVETFEIGESSTEPMMNHILDLTLNNDGVENSWEVAANFIKQKAGKGFHFEVVLKK